MMFSNRLMGMRQRFTALAVGAGLGATCFEALAHEGHGLSGAHHWHATDTLGFLLAAVAVAAGVWAWWRGRR